MLKPQRRSSHDNQPPATSHQPPVPEPRTRANRANALRSTGPRTAAGKQRSLLNALRHGLTAASPVLPSEDRAAYEAHCRGFIDECHPATPTESQLTQELADTAWRLNRIPLLEAEVFSQNPDPQSLISLLAPRHALSAPLPPVPKITRPAPRNVFSKDEVEAFSQRLMRLNESRHIEHVLFHMQPAARAAASY